MPIHDLHAEEFDQETKEKLAIYSSYLESYLPVFLNCHKGIQKIQVFDFFAGPGQDIVGNPGSPILTRTIVDKAIKNTQGKELPHIRLFFNEYDSEKFQKLYGCFESTDNKNDSITVQVSCKDFHEAFEEQYPSMEGNANLVFLDQNGVRQITEDVFRRIVMLPKTDLIFFISSAMANRFKDVPEIKQYLPLMPEDYKGMNGSNVHRRITNAYRRLIPSGHEYYLGSFSIRKRANVYGLIFGSGHPLGIEKFLNIAWRHGGDADFDIDEDHLDEKAPSLFEELNRPKKLTKFEADLAESILSRKITTNKAVYKYALENGVLARHARDAMQKMIKDGILPNQKIIVSYGAWMKPESRPILLKEKVRQ